MLSRRGPDPLTPQGAPELDELQRGDEKPVTVETLEPASRALANEAREVPIPDPGDRPGAVRLHPSAPRREP